MTEEQIDHMAKDMKPIAELKIVLFGEINNGLVGFALVMLDYNQVFKEMNGRKKYYLGKDYYPRNHLGISEESIGFSFLLGDCKSCCGTWNNKLQPIAAVVAGPDPAVPNKARRDFGREFAVLSY